MWLYATRGRRLIARNADPRTVAGITRSFRPGTAMYLGSTLIAYASAAVSVSLYGAIAIFYVIESSLFAGPDDAV
jgi:hypothetical protein